MSPEHEPKGEIVDVGGFDFHTLTDDEFYAIRKAGFEALDAQRTGRPLTPEEQEAFRKYFALEGFLESENRAQDRAHAQDVSGRLGTGH